MGGLTKERVRRDIEVLARAGLDTATFVAEAHASLQRAVPHRGTCVATVDPATLLLTGTFKFGDLYGNDENDNLWALIEYGEPDPTAFASLAERAVPAVAMQLEESGGGTPSVRLHEFLRPVYGYTDELRMVARHGQSTWGGLALFRGHGEAPFSEAETTFLASISHDFAAGLRSGMLVRLAASPGDHASGPTVVIGGADDRLTQLSVGADSMLRDLTTDANMADASGLVYGLVAGARRYAAGLTDVLPRTRVRLQTGRWLVLHASPLSSATGVSGDVVITIEEARPPEIVPLIVAAFELTARERDVTQLVLQGVETKEIAAALHMSRYTVQDHLKSVFDKANVRSRRELISRVFFDQYSPRMGGDLAPSGWFAQPALAD